METASFAITTQMLQPVLEGVTSALTAVVPVGLIGLGIVLGVRLVPKFLKGFIK